MCYRETPLNLISPLLPECPQEAKTLWSGNRAYSEPYFQGLVTSWYSVFFEEMGVLSYRVGVDQKANRPEPGLESAVSGHGSSLPGSHLPG